jgi:hypothetical protein
VIEQSLSRSLSCQSAVSRPAYILLPQLRGSKHNGIGYLSGHWKEGWLGSWPPVFLTVFEQTLGDALAGRLDAATSCCAFVKKLIVQVLSLVGVIVVRVVFLSA